MTAKIIGSLYLVNIDITITNVTKADGPTVASITDGYYFISDDGQADDLLKAVEDAIAALGANFTGLTLDLTTDHKVRFTSAADNYVVTWVDTELRDWFRFTGASTNVPLAGTATGSRIHAGGVYDIASVLQDTPVRPTDITQLRADNREVHSVFVAHHDEWALRIGITGGPRDSAFGQWHDIDEAHNNMTLGWPYRFYFDDSIATSYAIPTNPLGYLTLRLDTRRAPYRPRVRFQNRYTNFEIDLRSFREV